MKVKDAKITVHILSSDTVKISVMSNTITMSVNDFKTIIVEDPIEFLKRNLCIRLSPEEIEKESFDSSSIYSILNNMSFKIISED